MKTLLTEINKRNFGLDLFRTIAVLAVVLGHGSEFINIGINTWFPVDGVDMFFVLSGFLIGSILLRQDPSSKKKLFIQTLSFYKRRWFRTLPNYFLFLAINIILVKLGVYKGLLNINSFAYFAFLQNFIQPLDLFFWESWSLAVEEWFYLLFPLLIFVSFIIAPKQRKYSRHYLISSLLLLTIPLLLRILHTNPEYGQNEVDLFIRKIVVFRLDTIAYGLIGAYIFKYFKSHFRKYSFLFLIIGIVGIALLKHYDFNSSSFFRQTLYYSLQSLLILFWIPAFYSLKKAPKFFRSSIGLISLSSYSLYLIHMPVLYIFVKYGVISNNPTLCFMIYLIISLTLSYVVFIVWERPLTNIRDKKFRFLGLRF